MAEEEPTMPEGFEETLSDAPLELAASAEADPTAYAGSLPADLAQPANPEPYTDWGPPGAGRYLAAFLILFGITAIGLAVIWVLWGRQLWETFTGDWT